MGSREEMQKEKVLGVDRIEWAARALFRLLLCFSAERCYGVAIIAHFYVIRSFPLSMTRREAIAARRCGTTVIGVCIDFLEASFLDTKPPAAYLSAPCLELLMKLIDFVSPFVLLVSLDVLILPAYSLLSFHEPERSGTSRQARSKRHDFFFYPHSGVSCVLLHRTGLPSLVPRPPLFPIRRRSTRRKKERAHPLASPDCFPVLSCPEGGIHAAGDDDPDADDNAFDGEGLSHVVSSSTPSVQSQKTSPSSTTSSAPSSSTRSSHPSSAARFKACKFTATSLFIFHSTAIAGTSILGLKVAS